MSALVTRAATMMRQQIERHLLTDTCEIRATVGTADDYNADAPSWPVSVSTPCLVAAPPSSGAGTGGMIDVLGNQPGKTILISQGVNVFPSSRITPASSGITYEVAHVEPPGTHEPLISCQCIEI